MQEISRCRCAHDAHGGRRSRQKSQTKTEPRQEKAPSRGPKSEHKARTLRHEPGNRGPHERPKKERKRAKPAQASKERGRATEPGNAERTNPKNEGQPTTKRGRQPRGGPPAGVHKVQNEVGGPHNRGDHRQEAGGHESSTGGTGVGISHSHGP